MRYYETDDRSRRGTDLRVIGLGIAVVVLAGVVAFLWIRDDDDPTTAASTTTSAETTTIPATTTTAPPAPELTPTSPAAPAAGTPAAALVEDCVEYVPTAVYFGNFYMKAIWDMGGGTPEGLRSVCESMVTSDPAGLQRMSDELHALQAYVATTTTA